MAPARWPANLWKLKTTEIYQLYRITGRLTSNTYHTLRNQKVLIGCLISAVDARTSLSRSGFGGFVGLIMFEMTLLAKSADTLVGGPSGTTQRLTPGLLLLDELCASTGIPSSRVVAGIL